MESLSRRMGVLPGANHTDGPTRRTYIDLPYPERRWAYRASPLGHPVDTVGHNALDEESPAWW